MSHLAQAASREPPPEKRAASLRRNPGWPMWVVACRISPDGLEPPGPECSDSKLRLDGFDNRVEVRKLARLQFGIDLFPMEADLKGAAAGRDEFQRTDSLLKRQDFLRQTDGLRFVVSSRAIFDGDFRIHNCVLWRTIGDARRSVKQPG